MDAILLKRVNFEYEEGISRTSPPEICISNLTLSVTKEALAAQFAEFGTIISVDIALHPETGKNLGLALIQYTIQNSARKAAEHFNDSFFLGSRIIVELDEDGIWILPLFFW